MATQPLEMSDEIANAVKNVLGRTLAPATAQTALLGEFCTECGMVGHHAQACTTFQAAAKQQPYDWETGSRMNVDWEVCTRDEF